MGNALIFIKVYTNLKNGGIFALLGSLVTFLGTYLSTLNTKKRRTDLKADKLLADLE